MSEPREQFEFADLDRQFARLLARLATKAHTWYSTTGSASMKAAINVIFSGTMNGAEISGKTILVYWRR